MFLTIGVLVSLFGLILLGVSGNERAGKHARRGTRWLARLACVTIILGLLIAVGGAQFADEWQLLSR
jgi:hypothetical protein